MLLHYLQNYIILEYHARKISRNCVNCHFSQMNYINFQVFLSSHIFETQLCICCWLLTALLQLDIPLSLVFYKWLLGQEHSLTSSDLQHLDPVVAKSFQQLEDVLHQKQRILTDKSHVGPQNAGLDLLIINQMKVMYCM